MRVVMLLLCVGVIVGGQTSPFARAEFPARSGETSPQPRAFQGGGGGPALQPAPPSPERAATPPPNYSYSPEGRRDPFVSLLNRGTSDSRQGGGPARREGIAGLTVDEIVVRGIVQSRGGWVAMVGAPTGRTYTIRAGDRLMDGSVRAINAQTVILLQEVNDPLSLEKQREVRKSLRGEVK